MSNPLHRLAWGKLFMGWQSSSGLVVPLHVRGLLTDYLTEGVVDEKSWLYHLLCGDLDATFSAPKTPLEEARLQCIWEFIKEFVPTCQYGSPQNVYDFARQHRVGLVKKAQRRYIEQNAVDGRVEVD